MDQLGGADTQPQSSKVSDQAAADEDSHLTQAPSVDPQIDLAQVRKAGYMTAAFGIAHAVLFLAAFLIIRFKGPGPDPTDQELIEFYADPSKRRWLVFSGMYLIPFAGIAFIYFMVALRMWMESSSVRRHVLFSNIQLITGVLYLALLFASGAAVSVVVLVVGSSSAQLDPIFARIFPEYGSTLVLVFAMRMAAMFVFTSSGLGRAMGIVPTWFWMLGIPVGLTLLLSASISPLLLAVFPSWLILFSLLLLHRFMVRLKSPTLPEQTPSTTT